ncbi:MAG: adenine-specific DNA methylase [Candidatus Acidiferrales bacterium]
MKFSREWAMPRSDTFDCKPIREFVLRHIAGRSVDPFARNKRWATFTNDINPTTDAEHHMDAEDFLKMLANQGVKADCLILDPPYSPRQISECYAAAGLKCGMKDTQNAALYARIRRAARALLKTGSVVLSFGWNSAGMGAGFEKLEILLVAHGGAHNDTICIAEKMLPQTSDAVHMQARQVGCDHEWKHGDGRDDDVCTKCGQGFLTYVFMEAP